MHGLFIVFVWDEWSTLQHERKKKDTYISDAKTRKVIDAGLEMHPSKSQKKKK
jgi:hypothetical protein